MEAAWGHVLKLRCCPGWGDRFQSLTDTVRLTRSQNIRIQEQRVNAGFAPYNGLITHLQSTFLPSGNSALSKLNVFPQERRTSTGIHNPGPTESDPRLATAASLRAENTSSRGRHGCLLWSLPPSFLNWTEEWFKSVPFLPQTVLPL